MEIRQFPGARGALDGGATAAHDPRAKADYDIVLDAPADAAGRLAPELFALRTLRDKG